MNLILCGMMGCGKTTVGREFAKRTGKRWTDTDDVIVEKYGKIADIFARHGEGYFRAVETEVIKELLQEDGAVISVGGGLVLKAENVALLKSNGKIVYLRAREDTLFDRLQSDKTRPLLQGDEGLSARIRSLLQARAPIYEGVADFVVDVDGKTPQEIVAEVIVLFEN